jgi:molybdopterin molybdotransferase
VKWHKKEVEVLTVEPDSEKAAGMETKSNEMDEGTCYIGYEEAFNLVCSNLQSVGVEDIPLDSCVGRIMSEDLAALISYPSTDVSLKDGFAVRSEEVSAASMHRPVCLRVIGSVFAGSRFEAEVKRGSAVKICSGAPIPQGLNAVVSGEFCREASVHEVWICADAEPGRNVLRSGGEITAGSTIARRGEGLTPGGLGLAAAAGISRVRTYRRPRAALIGVGDEVISPGQPLLPNQLYASNLVTIGAWLTLFGVPYVRSVVKDNEKAIKTELLMHLSSVDTILTSGGAWGSERDLVVGTLHGLGWQKIFHNVRMGPGKGIAFGLLEGKPVFCLPGGPASNEMAFLQFALPGIFRLGGRNRHPLDTVSARLTENVRGRHRAWTEFKDATLSFDFEGGYTVTLYRNRSRLQSIAYANCLVCVPEGTESLNRGDIIPAQVLLPDVGDLGAGYRVK